MYQKITGDFSTGESIEGNYDDGAVPPNGKYEQGKNFKIWIYRITTTNEDGDVMEFNPKQVQDYCYKYGLNTVQCACACVRVCF